MGGVQELLLRKSSSFQVKLLLTTRQAASTPAFIGDCAPQDHDESALLSQRLTGLVLHGHGH